MLPLLLTFTGLSIVIAAAAVGLARFADRIGQLSGLGGSVVGLVLLAGATSLPELSVGYHAVRMDSADLAAGEILGSSLLNLLILAMLDLVSSSPGQILTRSAAAHALSGTVSVLLTSIILLGLLHSYGGTWWRAGPASWGVLLCYAACARLIFRSERESSKQAAAEIDADRWKRSKSRSGSWWLNVGGFVGAAAVIFVAAPYLSRQADELAEVTGLGETFVGTLFLALVTSLPEVVSTITALRLGAVDMAVSNIFGSNTFNAVVLATLDWTTPQSLLGIVSQTHAMTATSVVLTTAVALLSLLNRAEKRWWIIEPDAALVALMVVGALYLVYMNG